MRIVELDFALLNAMVKYNPEDGTFFWKSRTPDMFAHTEGRTSEHACANWNSRCAGKQIQFVVSKKLNRFNHVRILGNRILPGRLAWILSYGEWPKGVIDHFNRNPFDNRLENLRDVSQLTNMRNAKMPTTNTSGKTGVSYCNSKKRFIAYIGLDNKIKKLGSYMTFEGAVEARLKAEKEYGFEPD